ncbi:hypothetical protein BC939DRAFT_459341 [Gamsiella multidivaricata]|uniref:uncharacterized protein n=1 Tax=Gamsiella multidivaricata TaxID=101098 RepID=UPI00221FAC89|nr:uncharacterized protein BC939DRAFT_459341 [Gamsiella multidivaricata]KAI7819829.1 hypothetical protein BC939DRAFT_459341 [Gamsiella multidivaricata]
MGLSLSFSTFLWFFLCVLFPFRTVSLTDGIFVSLFAFFYTHDDRLWHIASFELLLRPAKTRSAYSCGAAFLP